MKNSSRPCFRSRMVALRLAAVALLMGTSAVQGLAQQTRPTSQPAADQSTPRQTLLRLNQALREGDVPTIKRLFLATNPSEAKMIDTEARMEEAQAELRRAAIKAYGPEDARIVVGNTDPADSLKRIESADIVVTGDTATVTYKDEKEQPHVLKKVDGQWRVPASELGKPLDQASLAQQLDDLAVQTTIVKRITQEIREGKFPTAEKARQAWRNLMLQAVTSQPTTRPDE